MMKKIILMLTVLVFCFADFVFCETTIKAQVNKKILSTDETLTYKVVITSEKQKMPEPKIPEFEGFRVISTIQSSAISREEDGYNTNIVYSFILAPLKTGTIEISPCIINIDNQTYSSDSFKIQVIQGKERLDTEHPEKEKYLPKEPHSLEESLPQITI